jgi:hypothetical protein
VVVVVVLVDVRLVEVVDEILVPAVVLRLDVVFFTFLVVFTIVALDVCLVVGRLVLLLASVPQILYMMTIVNIMEKIVNFKMVLLLEGKNFFISKIKRYLLL